MGKFLGFLTAVLIAASSATAVNITECGQVVPPGQVGVLTGNLACVNEFGVGLERRATLDLAGFTIEMAQTEGPRAYAIACADISGDSTVSTCSVMSSGLPGTLRSGGGSTVGIIAKFLRAQNLILEGFAYEGVQATKKAHLESVAVSDSQRGISADSVRAFDVTLTNNESALFSQKLVASHLTATGNSDGLVAMKSMRGENISVSGSFNGLRVHRKLRLVSSTITGNTIDVLANKRPRVTDVTCDVSRKLISFEPSPTETWEICASD